MLVEQALFTSAQTRQARGYHLVARSPGVTDRMAQTLSVWGPTHDSLLENTTDFHSLNYFVTEDGWGILSRTVYGQSEYSGRGGFRLETNLLVVRREQLSGYGHNALSVMRMAFALGHLRLRTCASAKLQPLELPGASILAEQPSEERSPLQRKLTDQILHQIADHRAAVIGAPDTLSVVSDVLSRLPLESRNRLSFTTGLKPSLHRMFDLQFLPSADKPLRQQLTASGIVSIDYQSS